MTLERRPATCPASRREALEPKAGLVVHGQRRPGQQTSTPGCWRSGEVLGSPGPRTPRRRDVTMPSDFLGPIRKASRRIETVQYTPFSGSGVSGVPGTAADASRWRQRPIRRAVDIARQSSINLDDPDEEGGYVPRYLRSPPRPQSKAAGWREMYGGRWRFPGSRTKLNQLGRRGCPPCHLPRPSAQQWAPTARGCFHEFRPVALARAGRRKGQLLKVRHVWPSPTAGSQR